MADEFGDSGTPSAAPAAPAPVSPTGTPSPSVSDAAPIAPSDGEESTATPSGPIPLDRHKAILEKARKEYEDKYGWAKDYNPEEVKTWKERMDLMRDPHRFHKAWSDWYQRTYGVTPAQAQAQSEKPDPEPAPDLVAENGQPVYSAPQLKRWNEWNQRQLEARFNEKLAPYEQERQQRHAQEEATEYAKRILQDLASLPRFEQLKPRIAELLKDGRVTPRSAYRKAYDEWEAGNEARIKKAFADELKKKADASTTNPSSPAASNPTDFKKLSWAETARAVGKQLGFGS